MRAGAILAELAGVGRRGAGGGAAIGAATIGAVKWLVGGGRATDGWGMLECCWLCSNQQLVWLY